MHTWMTIVDTVSHLLAVAAAALNVAAAARNHRRRPTGLSTTAENGSSDRQSLGI